MRLRRAASAAGSVLFALLSVFGCDDGGGDPVKPDPVGTAAFELSVTDLLSGEPIAGATVTTRPETTSHVTGDDGTARLSALLAGSYEIAVSAEGYAPAKSDLLTLAEGESLAVSITLDMIPLYTSSCANCHTNINALLASLEADPLPDLSGEAGSSGEG